MADRQAQPIDDSNRPPLNLIFTDGFESGDVSRLRNDGPDAGKHDGLPAGENVPSVEIDQAAADGADGVRGASHLLPDIGSSGQDGVSVPDGSTLLIGGFADVPDDDLDMDLEVELDTWEHA